LDFSINVILTDKGKIAGIFAGHFKKAHRKAIEYGKHVYSTKITQNNQICFFNSWPEDSELDQAQYKAFNFLMTAHSIGISGKLDSGITLSKKGKCIFFHLM